MSTPPARRPSIVRPQHPARAAGEAARNAPEEEPAAPAAADRRTPAGRASYAGLTGTLYFPSAEDRTRARNAYLARGGVEGYTSETAWWADVILAAVEQWEDEHNGGEPYELPTRTSRRRPR